MSDEHESDIDEPIPGRTKVIAGIVMSLALLLGGYAMLRVSSPAIRPDQVAPSGHYTLQCGFCHGISPDARAIEVAR